MNQVQRVVNPQSSGLADQLLTQVCERSPVVKRVLDNFGKVSLADYLQQTLVVSESPLQPRNDLLEVVYRYAESLLGQSVAEKVAQELEIFPAVMTANHHGVDFLAQSVQGSLIFSLRQVDGKPAKTVPVFACGNVAFNNPTYPRGILFYHAGLQTEKFTLPIRLPIFPDRYKRKIVSVVDAYDSKMLVGMEKRLNLALQDKKITPELAAAVTTILEEDYRNPAVMKLETYSQQAVVLNNRIWKRCFREPEQAPEMVCLELEKITASLLQADLKNEDSLVWQIMFNPILRAQVLSQLNGVKACWDQGKLIRRVCFPSIKLDSLGGCGTTFFWAVDDDGCRIPLSLVGTDRATMLQGRDDQGKVWTLPFKPENIIDNLRAGRLLPSLFTCYFTIGFARGVSCCGGYFQAEYLSVIQHGLMKALHGSVDCSGFALHLAQVPSDIYLSGMQTVMRYSEDDLMLPAGPVEMVARRGLSQRHLEKIRLLTLQDAHLAGLMETLPDFQRLEERPTNWCLLLAKETDLLLKGQIVLI